MTDHFGFTKLLVADLESTARFYAAAFGLEEHGRVQSEIADRKIAEIIFKPDTPGASGFVLLHFDGVTSPSGDEVILGFVTDDLSQLVSRVQVAGGSVLVPPRKQPEHGIIVAFVRDIEGHLIEVVEMLPKP
jgi:predicted enzyme related to lactoylglutathione lyase